MSPYNGLPQADFSYPDWRESISSLHLPCKQGVGVRGTGLFTTLSLELNSSGPPDYLNSLLLGERCTQSGSWVGEKFLSIPLLVPCFLSRTLYTDLVLAIPQTGK